jgi:hypothetical protein
MVPAFPGIALFLSLAVAGSRNQRTEWRQLPSPCVNGLT